MPGGLLHVLYALVIAALILWAILQFTFDETIKKLIKVVVIVAVVLYVLPIVIGWLGSGLR